jgi:hypothetical protein
MHKILHLRAQVPFIIRRRLPNGSCEDWAVSELIIEHVTLQVCVFVCVFVCVCVCA